MALKVALLCFQFKTLDEIVHDSKLEFDLARVEPLPGEALQPLVAEAVARIKRSIAASISSWFHFGQLKTTNINNFLHVAIMNFNTEIDHADGSVGQTSIVNTIKFYFLEDVKSYRVTLDIEEMHSSVIGPEEQYAYRQGINNKQVTKLVHLLDKEFSLNGRIESLPLLRRGRLDKPHYLISSDERVIEYDFDRVVFQQKSEYQDVKIVSSPSLGNVLLLDDLQNLAEEDLSYTLALMDHGNVSYRNKEILVLGGGDGGLLYELLKESPKFVTMAEIDPVVIAACRDHLKPCGEVLKSLEGPNYRIIIDDCMRVLRDSIRDGKCYDVIFNDLTDIPVTKRSESLTAFEPSAVQHDNQWHFIEGILNLSLDCLAPDGLYMNHATGKGNREAIEAYEELLEESKIPLEFESRSSYVPSFMEIWMFYTIKKKEHQTKTSNSTRS